MWRDPITWVLAAVVLIALFALFCRDKNLRTVVATWFAVL